MSSPEIPLNWDDFYKFVTSFTVITFLVGIAGATYTVLTVLGNFNNWIFGFTFAFYLFLGGFSVSYFFWALKKWKNNQEKIDAKLDAETALTILKVKKEAVEYQKQIDELAKSENPFSMFDLISTLKRANVEKRVEQKLK